MDEKKREIEEEAVPWFTEDEDFEEVYRSFAVIYNGLATRYDRPLIPGCLETLATADNVAELLNVFDSAITDFKVLANVGRIILESVAEARGCVESGIELPNESEEEGP